MSKLFTPKDLMARWSVTDNTLRRWRMLGTGPDYIKLGPGKASEVRYRLEDIERFEKENRIEQM
jgi:hypothetical protein